MPDHQRHPRLRLSFLVDQLGTRVGGGRFTTGFLHTLLNDPACLNRIERLVILRTQGEPVGQFGFLPANVDIVSRRFPARLRSSPLAMTMAPTCPASTVAHGPFFYVFPGQARSSLVTVHDVSFFVDGFHPSVERQAKAAQYLKVFLRCQAIACSSDATLNELGNTWPTLKNRLVRIYCGTAPLPSIQTPQRPLPPDIRKPIILAVGTIEPRKNYDRLLDAYEYLLSQLGESAPNLVVVGSEGWMCQATVQRLRRLQQARKVSWLQRASDDDLSALFAQASLFTYLSLYEGFGYPPFEAAFAGIPMVLSNLSSVGEIWRDHACCVDPMNVGEIVDAWRWALNPDESTRAAAVERQLRRASEFSWQQCVQSYLDLYEHLAHDNR